MAGDGGGTPFSQLPAGSHRCRRLRTAAPSDLSNLEEGSWWRRPARRTPQFAEPPYARELVRTVSSGSTTVCGSFARGSNVETCGGERGYTESGQVSGEYAIIIGVIALVCLVAVIVLGTGVREQFQSGGEQVQQTPFQPPTPSSESSWPSTLAECEHDGWRDFPQFANEADCRRYVDSLTP
jgi:Flp pilus assembly pilin Flp